jgi:hypothetical protein
MDLIERFIRSREKRLDAIARDMAARLERKRTGAGRKRREYHNVYYWQNAEKRRQQRLASHAELGKAHRYAQELRQEERRRDAEQSSNKSQESS